MEFNKQQFDSEINDRVYEILEYLNKLNDQRKCPHNRGWTEPNYWNDGTPECRICGVAMDGRS